MCTLGAMENWGLITFRESALLVDPSVSSTKQIQYIALIVAHEIAHQWFGNLVTMVRAFQGYSQYVIKLVLHLYF